MGFFKNIYNPKENLDVVINSINYFQHSGNEGRYEDWDADSKAQKSLNDHLLETQIFLRELSKRVSMFKNAIIYYQQYIKGALSQLQKKRFNEAVELIKKAKEANDIIEKNLQFLQDYDKKLK